MSLTRSLCRCVCKGFSRRSVSARSSFHTTSSQKGIFEPDDVGLGPEIPEYGTLNVQMKGYDFPTLESYAKFVHNLAERLGLDAECWAVPPKTSLVQVFKPFSTHVEKEYDLSLYERCVQIQDLSSTSLPVFLEIARANMPEGIKLTIKEPCEEEEEFRYIPDKELIQLHEQLDALAQAREDRKKK
ncbi:large ribosomal subunit protein mL48-like [Liolophura sinensis]|uniref:large ribosomal subunit protein mL48-like n=1 Tax=Liolophura sinensis TaxID=3198878 RepID=UPI0031581D5E